MATVEAARWGSRGCGRRVTKRVGGAEMKEPGDCRTIDDIRAAIDRIDQDVIGLLGRRAQYVCAAAGFKKDQTDVRAPERVEAMLRTRREWAESQGLDPDFIERLYRSVVEYFVAQELRTWADRQ
jgi:isochorismate pyruvate lyase